MNDTPPDNNPKPDDNAPEAPRRAEQTAIVAKPRKTVALTLGSGGARGYAHIGAIEVLQERGYDIIAISGCSMGALIGGVYAAGKMKDYKDWVTGLGQFDVLKLLDVTFNSAGAIRGEKVFSVVREMLGDTRIEDLSIPYTAVATDLLSHKEIWFQEGPVDQAIRASIAIPGLIAPMVLQGRVLVDGALLNPLPIIPTISSHADLIVAINLAGEDDQRHALHDAGFSDAADLTGEGDLAGEGEEWAATVREKASRWFDWDILKAFTGKRDGNDSGDTEARISKAMAEKRTASAHKGHEGRENGGLLSELDALDWDKLGIGRFDVMNLAIESMQSALVQYKIAGYPPDLLVNVPKNVCRTYDYHKAPELIQIGRERMTLALDRFEHGRSSSGPLAM